MAGRLAGATILASILIMSSVGCGEPDLRSMSAPQKLAYARGLYQRECTACHGISGDGQGKQALRYRTPPSDFTAGHFKYKSTPYGQPPLDKDLFRTIRYGIPTTAMMPQIQLSDEQIRALVDYVKTFVPPTAAPSKTHPIPIPAAPAPDKALVEQGEVLFTDAGCAQCHGAGGRGNGAAADGLHDYKGRPLPPPDLSRPPHKVGQRLEDLYRVIQTGMEGTPMPSYAGVLTDEQSWALAYFIQSLATAGSGD